MPLTNGKPSRKKRARAVKAQLAQNQQLSKNRPTTTQPPPKDRRPAPPRKWPEGVRVVVGFVALSVTAAASSHLLNTCVPGMLLAFAAPLAVPLPRVTTIQRIGLAAAAVTVFGVYAAEVKPEVDDFLGINSDPTPNEVGSESKSRLTDSLFIPSIDDTVGTPDDSLASDPATQGLGSTDATALPERVSRARYRLERRFMESSDMALVTGHRYRSGASEPPASEVAELAFSVNRSRADWLQRQGEYAEALMSWNRVIVEAPSDPFAFVCRGNCYRILGELDSSLSDADRAAGLVISPQFAGVQGLARDTESGSTTFHSREEMATASDIE